MSSAALDMVRRRFWLERVASAWQHRSVIWLSGVRRVGKARLCQGLADEVGVVAGDGLLIRTSSRLYRTGAKR